MSNDYELLLLRCISSYLDAWTISGQILSETQRSRGLLFSLGSLGEEAGSENALQWLILPKGHLSLGSSAFFFFFGCVQSTRDGF